MIIALPVAKVRMGIRKIFRKKNKGHCQTNKIRGNELTTEPLSRQHQRVFLCK